MSDPDRPDAPSPAPDLQRLRGRFIGLLVGQGVLGAGAFGFAAAYFVLHLAWGLIAFAVALGVAVLLQARFIWTFVRRKD